MQVGIARTTHSAGPLLVGHYVNDVGPVFIPGNRLTGRPLLRSGLAGNGGGKTRQKQNCIHKQSTNNSFATAKIQN